MLQKRKKARYELVLIPITKAFPLLKAAYEMGINTVRL
jgi:hypothetical protein